MTILLAPIGNTKSVLKALSKIGPTHEIAHMVKKSIDFLTTTDKNVSDIDLVLATSTLKDKEIDVVDAITKAQGTHSIKKTLSKFKQAKIPTNFSELSIRGDEVSGPKHERGNKLKEVLAYALKHKTNDRETLLKV